MRVLVAVADYPTPKGKRSLYFVHTRNIHYQQEGIDVTVLNFSADERYIVDGIQVITLADYISKVDINQYELLICHAANLRNHYRFLKKYQNNFQGVIFIYHGHEILHINKYYPKAFRFHKEKFKVAFFQDIYDSIKIHIWKKYIKKNIDSIRLIFVSDWLYDLFIKEFKIKKEFIENNISIISNSIGNFFEDNQHKVENAKYDFITIRNRFDESTYCIDIVSKLAKENPEYRFCIIGKGDYFNYNDKPDNIFLVEGELKHEEMREFLNASRIALMPTRHDSQGLMSCELASYGMPLITSNIEVCRKVFKTCPNVAFISNDEPDLSKALEMLKINEDIEEWRQYYKENTIKKEIQYIKMYFGSKRAKYNNLY